MSNITKLFLIFEKKKKVHPRKKEKLKNKFSPGKTKGQRMGWIWEREGRARYVLPVEDEWVVIYFLLQGNWEVKNWIWLCGMIAVMRFWVKEAYLYRFWYFGRINIRRTTTRRRGLVIGTLVWCEYRTRQLAVTMACLNSRFKIWPRQSRCVRVRDKIAIEYWMGWWRAIGWSLGDHIIKSDEFLLRKLASGTNEFNFGFCTSTKLNLLLLLVFSQIQINWNKLYCGTYKEACVFNIGGWRFSGVFKAKIL